MCGAAEKAEVYVMGKVCFPQLGKFIVAAIAHTCDGTSNVGGADISLRCSMLPTPELQGWGVFGTCILGQVADLLALTCKVVTGGAVRPDAELEAVRQLVD